MTPFWGEHEADTAHLAQVAAELIKVVAHVGSRAVAVIGQGLDHDGDAAGAVALVGDCFVLGLVAPRRLMMRWMLSLGTLLALALAIRAASLELKQGCRRPP